MHFSISFDVIGNEDIGLYIPGACGSPDLKTGVIIAFLQWVGIAEVSIER